METDSIISDNERFKKYTIYTDDLVKLSKKIPDESLRNEITDIILKNEDLFLNSSEWVFPNFNLKTIHLSFFGNRDCGKRDVIQRFLTYAIDDYSIDSSLRVKHIVTKTDHSKEVIMIRDDVVILPSHRISLWADCGIFCFNIYEESSYKECIINQKQFRKFSERAPTILVGICGNNKTGSIRNVSYNFLFLLAIQNGFEQYIEVNPANKDYVEYFFQYTTSLSLKYMENEKKPKFRSTYIFNEPEPIYEHVLGKRRKTIVSEIPKFKRVSIMESFFPSSSKYTPPLKRCKSNTKSDSTVSMTSIITASSIKNENVVRRIWKNNGIIKQGLISKLLDFGSKSVLLTLTKIGEMFYHKSKKHYELGKEPIFLNLLKFNVKTHDNNALNGFQIKKKQCFVKESKEFRTFEMIGISDKTSKLQKINFKAESKEDRDSWMLAINATKQIAYNGQLNLYQDKEIEEELNDVRKLPFNEVCAECNSPNPDWISCNLGIFICTRCSGGHRNLGVNISKVASTTLDTISFLQVRILKKLGNLLTNSVFEATLNITDIKRPLPGDDDVTEWLNMKYVEKRFMHPLIYPLEPVIQQLMFAIHEVNYRTQLICIHCTTGKSLDECFSIEDERNPLLVAVQEGDTVTVQLLLWAGVDVNYADKKELNAYGYTICNETKDSELIQEILIKHGVQIQDVINEN